MKINNGERIGQIVVFSYIGLVLVSACFFLGGKGPQIFPWAWTWNMFRYGNPIQSRLYVYGISDSGSELTGNESPLDLSHIFRYQINGNTRDQFISIRGQEAKEFVSYICKNFSYSKIRLARQQIFLHHSKLAPAREAPTWSETYNCR